MIHRGGSRGREGIMNVSKPLGPAVSEMSEVEVEADVGELARGHAVIRQGENGDGEVGVTATEFSRLLHRVSGNSQIYNREGALAAVRRCSLAFFGLAAIHFILAGLSASLG